MPLPIRRASPRLEPEKYSETSAARLSDSLSVTSCDARQAEKTDVTASRRLLRSWSTSRFGATNETVLCNTVRVSPDVEELVQRLDQLNEDLAELAMTRLRESIDAGGVKLPVDEKFITRARRSVEKAAALLRSTSDLG